jgi:hypothetical protein
MKEFLAGQGQSNTNIQDGFSAITAQILSETNGSMARDNSLRPFTNASRFNNVKTLLGN